MSRADEWMEYIVTGGTMPDITKDWPIVPEVER